MDSEWDDSGIDGVFRYLNKVWKFYYTYKDKPAAPTKESEYIKNKLISDITTRLEALSMNTVVSGFMEYTNKLADIAKAQDGIDPSCLETLAVLLAPFTPHIAAELWEAIGKKDIFKQTWPVCDESKLVVDTVEIALQINGKVRENMEIGKSEPKEQVLEKAKEALKTRLEGKTIVKEIYVPGRIVNIVVK